MINKGDRKLKTKIVLLPLDERPCNYEFPMKLFSHDKVEIVRPKKLGNKKTPASFETIVEFLREECKDASGLVVSMDMLLYGGLIPQRLVTEQTVSTALTASGEKATLENPTAEAIQISGMTEQNNSRSVMRLSRAML